MKKLFFAILSLHFLFSAVLLSGQNFPAGAVGAPVTIIQPITVNEARNLPKDSWVTLSGNIINSLPGGKYFTFRDSTGEITVEIDAKKWRGITAGPADRVEICGEVETKNGQVRIDVKAIAGPGQTLSGLYSVNIGQAGTMPNNSWVIISGNIVNSTGRKNYTFRDSTGEINIEIGTKEWRGLSAGPSDRVEIWGKVEVKRGNTSIEVEAVRRI